MLLILLNDNIYQISLKTKQIITNYIIGQLNYKGDDKILFMNSRFYKYNSFFIHYYNEKTQK